jgi:hypothetical protein
MIMRVNPNPLALNESVRSNVLVEMEKWSFTDTEAAVRHFAFSVPEGERFTEHDCARVLDGREYDSSNLTTILFNLRHRGFLLRKWNDDLAIHVFHIERRMREKYRADLSKKFDSNPEPEKRDISNELKELVADVSDGQESDFLDETMKCLEVNANRAAIVMAWNLAYHRVRLWILAQHLTAFNKELTSRFRSKTKTYDPVSRHDEFPDSEWFVLDVCRAAGFLDRHRFGILEGALKKRNRYAHPSPAKATGPEATGYVAELLRNVLLDPYFDGA